jgi:hypothetical protein
MLKRVNRRVLGKALSSPTIAVTMPVSWMKVHWRSNMSG